MRCTFAATHAATHGSQKFCHLLAENFMVILNQNTMYVCFILTSDLHIHCTSYSENMNKLLTYWYVLDDDQSQPGDREGREATEGNRMKVIE